MSPKLTERSDVSLLDEFIPAFPEFFLWLKGRDNRAVQAHIVT